MNEFHVAASGCVTIHRVTQRTRSPPQNRVTCIVHLNNSYSPPKEKNYSGTPEIECLKSGKIWELNF